MSKTHKIILLIAFPFLLISAISSCSKHDIDDEVFINQMGQGVRLRDFKGKVVLMNFIYTSCDNKGCDALSLQFLRLQLRLRDSTDKNLFFLSVSIDPEKDTPEVLKTYAQKFKVDPNAWFFLTGSPGAVERLMKKYAVVWKTDPDGKRHHRVVMALLDRDGRKAAEYNDYNYDTEKIIEDIKNLLDGRPLQNIPVQQ